MPSRENANTLQSEEEIVLCHGIYVCMHISSHCMKCLGTPYQKQKQDGKEIIICTSEL